MLSLLFVGSVIGELVIKHTRLIHTYAEILHTIVIMTAISAFCTNAMQ